MGALIDASVLIAAERGELDLEVALESMTDEYLGLSAITVSELLHGVHRADEEPRRSRREAYVEGLLSRLPVV
ncbi:MAG: PIN domain-containing protein, partial [Thermoanaerobaculia bacterium]|nr:PIN domain-containing protein [Thermoanaerobaculia bacterium]